MSMLAERKQKQRWYLNPRANKEWVQDSNKFGQRMLEKMGWTSGKGLGANEDGRTEHIKVKYKNDVQGIGYELRDDQWTQHENNFTQLLANLGNDPQAAKLTLKPEKSLEKKSQTSRARVHYHKFTRGKDLALKSEKDLANIFGRKTLEKPAQEIEKHEIETDDKGSKAFGIVTIKSGSMADYFKSKLGKLGDKFSSFTQKEENGEESESEIGTTAGFGFSSENKNAQNFVSFISSGTKDEENKQNLINFVSLTPLNEEKGVKRKREDEEKTSKKKKKKKNVAFDNKGNDIDLNEEVCYDNPCLNEEDNSIEEGGFSNPAFDPNDEPKRRKSVTFASPLAEYSTISDDSPKKKKKKKKKQQIEIGIDNPACEEFIETVPEIKNLKRKSTDIDEEISPKKSKKKKKNIETGIENLACEELESPIEQKKSKKKKKILSEETTPKKNKKKNKENGLTNLGCEETITCVDNLACSVDLIEEGIESITSAIDNYQTELENEMNFKKDKLRKKKKMRNSSETNN